LIAGVIGIGLQSVELLTVEDFATLKKHGLTCGMVSGVPGGIRTSKDYIGHYHTGGVPGRNEIDETQEIFYPAVMKAIVETGFKGFVGQEFIP
jgi:hypothetical protein